jgi:NAD(P)-dependent dehydrogenase (short-subunit alcohol dehydrogenase family)
MDKRMRKLTELMDLKGRVALVIGGAGHIGTAFCESLAELGAEIAVHDINAEQAERKAGEISDDFKVKSLGIGGNLLDEKETEKIIPKTLEKFGRLDILIHTAAFVGTTNFPGWAVPFEEQSYAAFESALRVNLTSAFLLAKEAKEPLATTGNGSIILVSSTYGLVGPDFSLYEGTKMANPAGYGASKGGILQLTRYLATLLAPLIRVNAITPGGVFRNQAEVFVDRYVKKTPMGRMAVEEDFKGAAAYLASDLSRYVTGQNLVVDGGFTAW